LSQKLPFKCENTTQLFIHFKYNVICQITIQQDSAAVEIVDIRFHELSFKLYSQKLHRDFFYNGRCWFNGKHTTRWHYWWRPASKTSSQITTTRFSWLYWWVDAIHSTWQTHCLQVPELDGSVTQKHSTV